MKQLTRFEHAKRREIVNALVEEQGNKLSAAKVLGIGRQTLYNLIDQFDVLEDEWKPYRAPTMQVEVEWGQHNNHRLKFRNMLPR